MKRDANKRARDQKVGALSELNKKNLAAIRGGSTSLSDVAQVTLVGSNIFKTPN